MDSLICDMHVLVRSWIRGKAIMLKEESFSKEFMHFGSFVVG